MEINQEFTYINKHGNPIIRRCFNCKHWKSGIQVNDRTSGYCNMNPMYFAYTLEKTVYPITHEYYYCPQHIFKNEEELAANSETILMSNAIEKKREQ